MTKRAHLTRAAAATPDVPNDPELALETASRTPVVITEQEVVLGTVAAVPVQPATTRWWTQASRVVLLAIRPTFLASTADARPARRHYPSRLSYLEHSCMAREIDRL
jgi:hypothetical protein